MPWRRDTRRSQRRGAWQCAAIKERKRESDMVGWTGGRNGRGKRKAAGCGNVTMRSGRLLDRIERIPTCRRGPWTPGAIFRGMSPTVLREGPFRLFFFSREEPRMHIHVSHPDGEAKFWLQPELALAESVGLSARQLADAQDLVHRHAGEIRDAWIRHFDT